MDHSPAPHRARAAVSALFLTNGAVFANIVPRFPEIKASLALDNTTYGIALAAFSTGAIVAGLGAAAVIRRFGSARTATLGTVMIALGVWAAGSAPTVALFMVCLFVAGATDAIVDVAQNAHGLRVQDAYGRSIINSFHAIWSLGAMLGGLMAGAAIALAVPLPLHLAISSGVFAAVALVAFRFRLPGPDRPADEEAIADIGEVRTTLGVGVRPGVAMTMLALVLIAVAGTVVEDAGFSWATLYLAESLSAPVGLAAAGYVALVGAQFIGRLVGDRLVDRFGQRSVARSGGLLVTVGMGLALWFPSVLGTIAGFAAAGFGVATLVPAAMFTADRLPGLRHGTGLTVVAWLMRLGSLLAPPTVGLIADNASLRVGLTLVPVAGIVVMLLAGVLGARPTPHQPR